MQHGNILVIDQCLVPIAGFQITGIDSKQKHKDEPDWDLWQWKNEIKIYKWMDG